ncbi:hypothetical protein EFL45_07115 [Weissella confusa]|uniref:hypothetical protein n=1 Tax=Weissella confusa TaxID=1583 RepID=UPI00223A9C57|nr:hypothetical protein [Weissella confusa]MCT0949181.1 hypothetical protein [Weissella confusa]
MRYEHYEPRATVDNTKEWRNAVMKALTVIDDEALRDALFDSLTATKAYADNEDENYGRPRKRTRSTIGWLRK